MKYLLLFLPVFLLANNLQELKDKYDYGNMYAGEQYALFLYKDKKYDEAAEIFLNISQSTEPGKSSFYMGEMLEFGYGVNKDCYKSGIFYWESIRTGVCDAYLNMSKTYKIGGCLIKNKEKSDKMLLKYKSCINK